MKWTAEEITRAIRSSPANGGCTCRWFTVTNHVPNKDLPSDVPLEDLVTRWDDPECIVHWQPCG